MSEWQEVTLESLSSYVSRGVAPKYTDNPKGAISVINQKCIRDYKVNMALARLNDLSKRKISNEKLLQTYDVLINSTGVGTLGRVGQFMGANGSATIDSHVTVVRPNTSIIDPIYFGYLIKAKQNIIESFAEGSTGQTELNRDAVKNLKLPFDPNMDVQTYISGTLKALDDKIELNQRMNETLEGMARSIFKSWFVDFDPVHAKAEGREPEGMDARTAALFPSAFNDNGLPEGWKEKPLGDLADILNGYAFKSEDYQESGLRLLRTKNFSEKGYAEVLSDDVFVPDEFWNDYQKYQCELFDFHLVMVGASVGKTSYALSNMLPCLRNQNMWCFRPKIEGTRFFVNLATEKKVSEVMGWASGSARTFFKKGDFQKHTVVYPNDELAKEFSSLVEPLYKKYDTNVKQNQTLAALRDTLLPKLISGELRVDTTAAEKLKEAVG